MLFSIQVKIFIFIICLLLLYHYSNYIYTYLNINQCIYNSEKLPVTISSNRNRNLSSDIRIATTFANIIYLNINKFSYVIDPTNNYCETDESQFNRILTGNGDNYDNTSSYVLCLPIKSHDIIDRFSLFNNTVYITHECSKSDICVASELISNGYFL